MTQGAYLNYYEDEKIVAASIMADREPLATLDIRYMKSVEYEAPEIIRLVLSGTTKAYLLQALSIDEAKEWVENLKKRRGTLLEALKEPRADNSIDVKDRTLTPKTLAIITDAELMALSSMKQKFSEENYKEPDSALCLRFLLARKGKVPDAIDFLCQHLDWRRSTFPIQLGDIEEELRKGNYVLRGVDRDGDVIIYIRGCYLGLDTYLSLENHMP